MKLAEDLLELALIDSDSGVADENPAYTLTVDALELYATLVRVTNRVGDEVLDDLRQQIGIAVNDGITRHRGKRQPAVLRLARKLV